MKIIPQLTQLSDSELKDIFNNDPEVMTKIIEDAFLNSNLKSAAESFASEIMERMKKAFQILVENMISEEFFAMLDEAEENGKNLSRNGYYSRLIRSSFGEFRIQFPRVRYEEFKSKLLGKYSHNIGNLSDHVLSLYKGGMTQTDIVKTIESIEGIGISRGAIAKIVNETVGEALMFNSEAIEDCPIVYLDATYVPFKRAMSMGKSVEKEGILVALGITPSGYRKVLGYSFGETEKIELWEILLRDLKIRGLKNPKVFVTDGLSGMPEAIQRIYPNAKHQRCIAHFIRNLCSYVKRADRKKVCEDFKKVYTAPTREEAEKEFQFFSAVWGSRYIGLRRMLEKTTDNIFPFLSFPPEIRKSLYTSNAIEGFNSKLKRETRKRIMMNSENNATIIITAICRSYNSSKLGRKMNGLNELTPDVLEELGFNAE